MKIFSPRYLGSSLLFLLLAWVPLSYAEDAPPLKVVASFSILGDLVKAVGGDRIELKTLVGPDGDAHVFSPTPADAKKILGADILFVNGFEFEGWLDRLVDASGYSGKIITATEGITGLSIVHEDDADKHEDEHGGADPHAWLSLAHVKTYVRNITDALQKADPSSSAVYESNHDSYVIQLSELEKLVTETLDTLPEDRRTVVTSHDAFGYFADSHRLKFLAPQGFNTESEATARDVAALIEQIRAEKITALFMENVVSPRLLTQIAAESGVEVGGTLYADALSQADKEASTYLKMMRHNIQTLYKSLSNN